MPKSRKSSARATLRSQSRRLRDTMIWVVRGFSLEDPRKSYPGFYLSPQQAYVLSVVKEVGSTSPGDVAKRLRLEKSHLTKIVNSLLALGALEKSRDTEDRRRIVLVLTEKGKKMYRELDKVSIDSYMMLMEHIPAKEREAVIHATNVMLQALRKMRSKKGA